MPKSQTQKLLSEIEGAIDRFDSKINPLQIEAFKRIQSDLQTLETSRGRIRPTVANLRKIKSLRANLSDSILNQKYTREVGLLEKSFNEIEKIQTSLFSSALTDFEAPAIINEIKSIAISSMQENLLGSGVQANIVQKAQDIVVKNITANASFDDLFSEMKTFLVKTETTPGALSRMARTFTTDALNTFAADYSQAVTNDLGLEWYQYVGSLVRDSRPFCIELIEKEFIHQSELSSISAGIIDGKKSNEKGSFQAGSKPGRNENNVLSLRGGWNCNHLFIPVEEEAVPDGIREKFDSR